MTRGDEGSSSGAVLPKVYVAVGSDGDEGKLILQWALQNFGGDFNYCILHVGQPGELARKNTPKILDACIQICNDEKVFSMKLYAEMQDVRQGIVELVEQHCIRKLVMGAAADRRYKKGMAQLKSTKAMFVNQHAHPSCEIWFICRGNFVSLRESSSSTSYPVRSHVQSGQSTPGSDNSGSDLVQFESSERSKESSETDLVPAVHQPPEGIISEELCVLLDRALSELAKAKRKALEELIRCQKAEKAAKEAKHRAGALENSHAKEVSSRIDLEKKLKKERERRKTIKNERNDLQMQLDALANRQDQEVIAKFSLSEIEAQSKIEEGDYGSTSKGFLRHTPVVIKMYSDSSEGTSKYHQEVRIASVLRHPNLVTLIGVCPEASALIYEYLPNGNLEDRLNCKDNAAPLSWQTRIQICRDTCAALIFLHSFEPHGIAHGDLTPKNILLDANFVAKLSNFRSRDAPFSSHATGDFSAEADIYLFGVVLLRLLVGQAALDLDDIVQNALNNNVLGTVLDRMAGQWPLEQVTELARVALSCCGTDNSNLDLRSEVWPLLEQIQTLCEQASSSDHSSGGIQRSSSSDHPPSEEHTQPPPYFLCPITRGLMEDPVMAADGHTYEAVAIRGWLNRKGTSPMTNLRLQNLDLIPNRNLQSAIEDWRRINGN